MMKKITKSIISISLASMLLLIGGCGNNAASTAIESSTLDTTVEDINVTLTERERYTNPLPAENQPYRALSEETQILDGVDEKNVTKDNGRTGDPYILRYNGKYYLYVSTDEWYCSYRVWESLDLIHYTYLGEYDLLDKDGKRTEGDTAAGQGFALECPWAPEVHYWNGEFYMYTSPHASGHQVLKSTTGLPYGDYQVVNEKFDAKLDGTFFIDDNEDKWFVREHDEIDSGPWTVVVKATNMYTLEDKMNYQLTSKTGIPGEQIEGGFLFKRDGIYYLISTGEAAGAPAYRINYAYNDSGLGNGLNIGSVGATENWSTEIQPNVLLRTEGEYYGYGHGAVTVGPNLDSYWLPYHITRASGARTFGINRIEFAGTRMSVIGQDKETMVPEEPDFYTSYFTALSDVDWEGKKSGVIAREAGYRSYTEERTQAGEGLHKVDGKLLSGRLTADGKTVELIKTGSRFTAEYNFKKVATNGSFKCLFGGGYVTINNGKTVELHIGSEKVAEAPMLVNGEAWNWSAYHDIIVIYEDGRITVAIDGCTKIDVEATGLGNDAIGFEGASGAQIGGAVFSNQAFGSSDKEVAKMSEGNFFATNYYEAKEGEKATSLSAKSSVYKVETEGDEDVAKYGTVHTYHIYKDAEALKLAEGDRAVYVIDVAEDGLYSIESLYSTDNDGSVIKIQIDKDTPTCYTLKKNDYSSHDYDKEWCEGLKFQKRLIDEIYLTKGLHTLTVKAVQGDYTAIEYEMNRTSETSPEYSDDLSKKAGHSYFSNWIIKDGAHYAAGGLQNLVRFGGSDFTDYKVKVDIKTNAMMSRSNKAGILLRLDKPTIHARQTYGSGRGYFVCIDAYGVSLERFDYNERLVAYYETSLDKDTYYSLEAECIDNRIIVYLDGEKVIEYTDPYGFSRGAAAIYSYQAETYYKNLEITPK